MENSTATTKQVAFIERLAAERGLDVSEVHTYYTNTKAGASVYIDHLLSMPKAGPSAPAFSDEELVGFHYVEGPNGTGSVYKVQMNRAGTRGYAKELRGTSWEYVGRSPMRDLSPDTKLTYETVRRFGQEHEICMICGIHLDNTESRQYGIGPTCYRNLTGMTFAQGRKAGELEPVIHVAETLDREALDADVGCLNPRCHAVIDHEGDCLYDLDGVVA